VIQAYVADSTDPKDRARALGWLSATTNLGVALGRCSAPLLSHWASVDLMPDRQLSDGARRAGNNGGRAFVC